MGTLYLRGKTWWIKYYHNGEMVRESSGSGKKMIAKELLAKREADIAYGRTPGVHFEKVLFKDLAEDFLRDYRINKKRSLARADLCVRKLKRSFGRDSVPAITTPRINQYIEKRMEEGAANATINRELSALKRMLNLGAEQTPPLVDRVPKIKMLQEDNVRTGFFEHDEFLGVRDALPDYLQGFVTFGYKYGWRFQEIAGLTWAQVDRDRWTARLEVGTTKNKAGRMVFLDPELIEIFKTQWKQRSKHINILPYVFPNRRHTGKIVEIRFAWKNALKEAGVSYKLFHDLRRTAVRNMVRAGVPENVAMRVSGHKTRAVFDRYNIVDERDLLMATELREKYLAKCCGHNLGAISGLEQNTQVGCGDGKNRNRSGL